MQTLCHAELRFQSCYFYQCCRMFGSLLNSENLLKHDNVVFKTCLNKTNAEGCVCSVFHHATIQYKYCETKTVSHSNYSVYQLIFIDFYRGLIAKSASSKLSCICRLIYFVQNHLLLFKASLAFSSKCPFSAKSVRCD